MKLAPVVNSGVKAPNGSERLRSLSCAGFPDQAMATRGGGTWCSRADHFFKCASSAARYEAGAGTVCSSVFVASGNEPSGQCTSNGGGASHRATTEGGAFSP